MKVNYLSIVGGILAFVSLLLPWWTTSISVSAQGTPLNGELSVYPYQATAAVMQAPYGSYSQVISMNLWFGWIALTFVVIGGWMGLAGGLATRARMLPALGGMFIVSSIILFAAGLQDQLSNEVLPLGWPTGLSLFSSGSYDFIVGHTNYSAYLSLGFWWALISGVMMFAALMKNPDEAISSPPSPQSQNVASCKQTFPLFFCLQSAVKNN